MFNIVLFGEAGVGKSSIINLLAGKEIAETSTGPLGCTLRSRQYTFTLMGKTFNIWDTIGLGEPSFGVSNALSAIEEMCMLIRQIEQQGGLHLLLHCICAGRITQVMLHNHQLFFEVLCDKRIPIAIVVTHLENQESMEGWWYRNKEHITRCGLEFNGHACVTGLSYHQKASESRAALESLLLDLDLGGNRWTPLSSDWVSAFLERLSSFTGETSKVKLKKLERSLRNRCIMDSVSADKPRGSLTSVLGSSSSDSRSAPLPLRDPLVVPTIAPLRYSSNILSKWFKRTHSLPFQTHDDDILVFLVGPSGSGKSTFMKAVTQVRGLVDTGLTLRPSTKVAAIRLKLTEEGRITLRAGGQRNIVFVDTPSFSTNHEGLKAVREMSTWLKRSKFESTCFGTIYLHRIGMKPDMDSSCHIQWQLDTFSGTFPLDLVARAFPQRLHCVLSCYNEIDTTEILRHREMFRKQLSGLRPTVVNGWRSKWETSIHPNLFMNGDPETAWRVVKALFPSLFDL